MPRLHTQIEHDIDEGAPEGFSREGEIYEFLIQLLQVISTGEFVPTKQSLLLALKRANITLKEFKTQLLRYVKENEEIINQMMLAERSEFELDRTISAIADEEETEEISSVYDDLKKLIEELGWRNDFSSLFEV